LPNNIDVRRLKARINFVSLYRTSLTDHPYQFSCG
jgi:hypothetical protein